ncbi:isochorismatase family protein [Lysobacter changpingensis]|uniref:isochorismatase family protein n=1 Tax=Lysobacter changpingensis TaxID=2792784 RepID=UPI001A8D37F6|nr:isochorismatase family protein [Lysobacter changpingensis]
MSTALILIDLQNDYFPGGRYPLWNADATLAAVEAETAAARARGEMVIHVQHIATPGAPFFEPDTDGVAIHPRAFAVAPDAPVIVKHHADSFRDTGLEALLARRGVERLRIAGMMTQNCVTHTALSRSADRYRVEVLAPCTTTVDEMVHRIALSALSDRVPVVDPARA